MLKFALRKIITYILYDGKQNSRNQYPIISKVHALNFEYLTIHKIENFYPSKAGFWFDKIVQGLTAAKIAKYQMYEIIYQAMP